MWARREVQVADADHWKAVIDSQTDEIFGVALIGDGSDDVVSVVQMAMLGGLSYQQVLDAVLTHPTMSEGLNLLVDTLDDSRQSGDHPTRPGGVPIP